MCIQEIHIILPCKEHNISKCRLLTTDYCSLRNTTHLNDLDTVFIMHFLTISSSGRASTRASRGIQLDFHQGRVAASESKGTEWDHPRLPGPLHRGWSPWSDDRPPSDVRPDGRRQVRGDPRQAQARHLVPGAGGGIYPQGRWTEEPRQEG